MCVLFVFVLPRLDFGASRYWLVVVLKSVCLLEEQRFVVRQKRIPVVAKIEFFVCSSRVAFVDAQHFPMSRVGQEKVTCNK